MFGRPDGVVGRWRCGEHRNAKQSYARPLINNARVKTVYALTSHEILTPSTTRFHVLAVPVPVASPRKVLCIRNDEVHIVHDSGEVGGSHLNGEFRAKK